MADRRLLLCLFLLTVLHGALTQQRGKKVGDRCLEKHSNSAGQCAVARSCKPARDDYYNSGIQPTYCNDNDSPLICCRDGSNILQTPEDRAPTTDTSSQSYRRDPNDRRRVSERKCEEYSRSVTQSADILPLQIEPEYHSVTAAKCNFNKVELIIGGTIANLGEFPHMAAIGWPSVQGGFSFKCGGILISEKFVVTAGHCSKQSRSDSTVTELVPTVVRLGDQNVDPTVNDGANPVEIPIKAIHKHPDFAPPKQYNDLALLELANAAEFETNIRPACLWTKPDFAGQSTVIATGWGVTKARRGKLSMELQKVSLTLYENEYCDILLYRDRNKNWNGFADSQMCAAELKGGHDTCQGDSGGPLQFAAKDNPCIFYLAGITSFGKTCAERNKPAIYTRVSYYLDWIEKMVWPNEN